MGLYNRISNMLQSDGLLAKAEAYRNKNIEFFDWCKKNNFTRCGIYQESDGFYHLTDCAGFDLKTISLSVSTKDFWDGLLKEKKTVVFKDDTLLPLMQFFSEKIKGEVRQITVLPFISGGKQAYFLLLGELDAEKEHGIIFDLTKILSKENAGKTEFDKPVEEGIALYPASLFIISAKLAVEKEFSQFQGNLREDLISTAMKNIFHLLSPLFQAPNILTLGSDFELKAVLFTKDDVEPKLIQYHINKSLGQFFENNPPASVLVLLAGKCFNAKGTKSFLLQG